MTDLLDELPDEGVLPSFAVLARFPAVGPDGDAAAAAVRERVTAARGLYDDVRVERQEPDGTWLVEVRFVVVSVDASTAVQGVVETLTAAGPAPDEVWAEPLG